MPTQRREASLRFLSWTELVIGRRLPGHIRNSAGKILLRRGNVLMPEQLESLRQREEWAVYGGPDWPPRGAGSQENEPDPAEVIQALRLRRGPKKRLRVRTGRRHPWCIPLTLEIEEVRPGGTRRRHVEVTTHDICTGGFAFIFNQFVHPETIVRARFESLPTRPYLTGVVRNCVHLSGTQHRVGVEFVDAQGRTDGGRG